MSRSPAPAWSTRTYMQQLKLTPHPEPEPAGSSAAELCHVEGPGPGLPQEPWGCLPSQPAFHLSMGTTSQALGLALQVSTHYDRLLFSPVEAGLGQDTESQPSLSLYTCQTCWTRATQPLPYRLERSQWLPTPLWLGWGIPIWAVGSRRGKFRNTAGHIQP